MSVIDVVTSGINKHADHVQDVADQIDLANGAAAQVSMQGEAYGMLCSPILVPILGMLEGAGGVAISSCAAAVDGTVTALRAMAKSLEIVDGIAEGLVNAAGEI